MLDCILLGFSNYKISLIELLSILWQFNYFGIKICNSSKKGRIQQIPNRLITLLMLITPRKCPSIYSLDCHQWHRFLSAAIKFEIIKFGTSQNRFIRYALQYIIEIRAIKIRFQSGGPNSRISRVSLVILKIVSIHIYRAFIEVMYKWEHHYHLKDFPNPVGNN